MKSSRQGGTIRPLLAGLAVALLAGCGTVDTVRRAPGQFDQIVGPRATENSTPLAPAFACMRALLTPANRPALKIGVGQVRDYTGKFSEQDGGSAITQGGSLMTMSALGKLKPAVRVFERFDTSVPEWELGVMSKRYLGDERQHPVDSGNGRVEQVPWKPYMGGTVVGTDYFIIGGITELNYAVHSEGLRFGLNQIGPHNRTFVANVAVDLRLVDTSSLEVLQTVSLQKQVMGYEVGFSTFKFFDNTLVDFEAGSKNNEPMQLAVRTTLEQAVLQLLGPLAGVDAGSCIDSAQAGPAGAGMVLSQRLSSPPEFQLAATPAATPGVAAIQAAPADGLAPLTPPLIEPTPVTVVPMLPGVPDTAKPGTEPGGFGPRGIGIDASRRPRGQGDAP